VNDEAKLEILRRVAKGFDQHDLDAIMEHFTDDCVFEGPRRPHPYGQVFVGKQAVRAAFAGRFTTIPDVRYTQDSHFVCDDRGVSEWTISGTTVDGDQIEARGCDIWTFAGNKIALKNSFWKLRTVEQPELVKA
jgi:taurine dehydrogenase small subunit